MNEDTVSPSGPSPVAGRGTAVACLLLGGLAVVLAGWALWNLQQQREAARETAERAKAFMALAERTLEEATELGDRRHLAEAMFPLPRSPFGSPPSAAGAEKAQIPPPPPRMHEILGTEDLKEPAPEAMPTESRGVLRVPEAAKAMELAKLKEADQDVIGALKHLDLANHLEPNHPEVLYRMAVLYDKLGNRRRATDLFQTVAVMEDAAGELAGLALHHLSGNRPGDLPGGLMQRPLRIGPAFAEVEHGDTGERTVKLSLSIRAQHGASIDPQAVVPYIYFYDLIDGSEIVPCDGQQPPVDEVNPWRSENPDYQDPGEELLDVTYHIPAMEDGSERQFFGYVVKLYYRDEIQDVLIEPRVLVELLSEGTSDAALETELEATLFEIE